MPAIATPKKTRPITDRLFRIYLTFRAQFPLRICIEDKKMNSIDWRNCEANKRIKLLSHVAA